MPIIIIAGSIRDPSCLAKKGRVNTMLLHERRHTREHEGLVLDKTNTSVPTCSYKRTMLYFTRLLSALKSAISRCLWCPVFIDLTGRR